MLAISLRLSVPHMIDSYWLAILILKIRKKFFFSFLAKHNAASIVKDKSCFKSLDNPSRIDIFMIFSTVFSRDLSHFHKVAVTVFKPSFSKAPPKEMLHRDLKNFEQDKFKYELKDRIQNESIECYGEFFFFFCGYAKWARPFKRKFVRVNFVPHMTKRLRKAIMKRSELKSKYLKI